MWSLLLLKSGKKIVAKNVKLVESWRFSNPVFSLSFPVVDADGGVPAQRGPLGVVRDLVVESHHQMIYQVLNDHMAMYSHRPHMII